MRRSLVAATLVILACVAAGSDSVRYRRIPVGEFQTFLVNWDAASHPVLVAVARTPAEYTRLFHPAATAFSRHHYAPDPKLFASKEILVAGRVVAGPPNMDDVFEVESVHADGSDLSFHYRFRNPASNTGYTVKDYVAVEVPKHDYRKIRFFEDGKLVGQLDLTKGQWAIPEPPPSK